MGGGGRRVGVRARLEEEHGVVPRELIRKADEGGAEGGSAEVAARAVDVELGAVVVRAAEEVGAPAGTRGITGW